MHPQAHVFAAATILWSATTCHLPPAQRHVPFFQYLMDNLLIEKGVNDNIRRLLALFGLATGQRGKAAAITQLEVAAAEEERRRAVLVASVPMLLVDNLQWAKRNRKPGMFQSTTQFYRLIDARHLQDSGLLPSAFIAGGEEAKEGEEATTSARASGPLFTMSTTVTTSSPATTSTTSWICSSRSSSILTSRCSTRSCGRAPWREGWPRAQRTRTRRRWRGRRRRRRWLTEGTGGGRDCVCVQ